MLYPILPFYVKWLLCLAMIYTNLSLSWLLMRKFSGYVNFAHTIPFALATYLFAPYGFAGIFIAAGISIALLLPLSFLNRERFVFATLTITILFWQMLPYVTIKVGDATYGGEEGVPIPTIGTDLSYFSALLTLFAFYYGIKIFERTRYGLLAVAVAENEIAAEGVGVDVLKFRAAIFSVSCLLASTSGAVYAVFFGHASPEIANLEVAVFPFVASLAGLNVATVTSLSIALVFITRGIIYDFRMFLYATALIFFPLLEVSKSAGAERIGKILQRVRSFS